LKNVGKQFQQRKRHQRSCSATLCCRYSWYSVCCNSEKHKNNGLKLLLNKQTNTHTSPTCISDSVKNNDIQTSEQFTVIDCCCIGLHLFTAVISVNQQLFALRNTQFSYTEPDICWNYLHQKVY